MAEAEAETEAEAEAAAALASNSSYYLLRQQGPLHLFLLFECSPVCCRPRRPRPPSSTSCGLIHVVWKSAEEVEAFVVRWRLKTNERKKGQSEEQQRLLIVTKGGFKLRERKSGYE